MQAFIAVLFLTQDAIPAATSSACHDVPTTPHHDRLQPQMWARTSPSFLQLLLLSVLSQQQEERPPRSGHECLEHTGASVYFCETKELVIGDDLFCIFSKALDAFLSFQN